MRSESTFALSWAQGPRVQTAKGSRVARVQRSNRPQARGPGSIICKGSGEEGGKGTQAEASTSKGSWVKHPEEFGRRVPREQAFEPGAG